VLKGKRFSDVEDIISVKEKMAFLSGILITVLNNDRRAANIVKNWREIISKISRLLISAAFTFLFF
jgi:hypothetical protein